MKFFLSMALGLAGASVAFGDSLFLDAADFNAFVKTSFTGSNSDVQGRVATGGNFSVQNYGVGASLTSFTGNALEVDGKLSYNSGEVFFGSATTADTSPTTSGLTIPHGSLKTGTSSGIYIPTLMTELVARSGYVGSLANNGSTSLSFGTLTLSGGTGTTRIYSVTAAQLSSTTSFVLNAPAGTTAVINVSGTSATFQNAGFSLTGGVTSNDVLFNFWGAKTLTLAGVGIEGTVFAPQADVSFSNGQLDGQLIANSFNGSGELHLNPFAGTVPVPEPAAVLAIAVGLVGIGIRRRK